MKFIKYFENYSDGKFRPQDIELAWKSGKGIRTSIVKRLPTHDPKEYLKIVNFDSDTDEIGVSTQNGIFYVDLKNVEEIES